jgi:hypothetical protein
MSPFILARNEELRSKHFSRSKPAAQQNQRLSGAVDLIIELKPIKLLLNVTVISFTYTSNEDRRNRQAQDPF